MIRILAVIAALVCAAPAIAQPLPANLDKQNAIVIDTTKGRIVIKLRTDLAPKHAERHQATGARRLLQQRAVPPCDGWLHGADRRRPEFQRHRRIEISEPEAGILQRSLQARHRRHGAARRQRRQRELAVLHHVTPTAPSLDGQYTVVGEVVSGMDVVDKLKKAPPGSAGGTVTDPDKMVKVQVASDIK